MRLRLFLVIFSSLMALTACGGGDNKSRSALSYQLKVKVAGSGSVTSSPAGINCPTTCSADFASGSPVTLSATGASGSQFGGFGGACSGTSCHIVLSANQSVSATFTYIAAQLTISVSGKGTVMSNAAGINCRSVCTATFNNGTPVALNASASAGYSFSGFGGACSGSNCNLMMSTGQNLIVRATFVSQGIDAINHIIVMLQENRSFDHYFGHLPDYWKAHGYPQASNGTTFDGEPATASNPDPTGAIVNAYNLQSACTENPSPSWNESHVDRNLSNPTDANNATMDGFVHTGAGDASVTRLYDIRGHRSIGYFVGDNQLNYYYFMASNFATSDRWFCPLMSRTQPNRMYLYAATSEGHVYPLPTSGSPPLTAKTIFELLQDNGITWKIYVHPGSAGCASPSCLSGNSFLTQFTYYRQVVNNMPNQFGSIAQLINDMQNGTLPQVSFIEPAGYVHLDEHSSDFDVGDDRDVQAGAAYVSSMINALMSSPSWKDSVFILSYDEPGGFYDHVPPQPAVPPDNLQFPVDLLKTDICADNKIDPICGFFFTGFRVPLVVISPFAKVNYVSHTVMDYTAILKFIETRFHLPSLTARDAAQPDMSEFFDFVNVPWTTPPPPPQQLQNMPCILEALSGVTISPNPAPAGGQATVKFSLSKQALENVTLSLSASSPGVLPASTVVTNGTSSTSVTIAVPTGISSLTITGSIAGIPVSGTVAVH